MKRIKKNDPAAMVQMGKKHFREGDYGKAVEYYAMAAELGDLDAHASLGGMYLDAMGVEKDEKKAMHHLEKAAIDGHPGARHNLAVHEMSNGMFVREAKHQIIAANLGFEPSLKCVKDLFIEGVVSKEDYAAALRGYQAAVDATKSAGRDKAEVNFRS